tara:strand:- start:2840 stop:3064 length:225 start_codon:yes stop_codon:yes gene_type:complete
MAIDIVAACETSESAAMPSGFFVGMSVLFAVYIGLDTIIAALVVRRKLQSHTDTPARQDDTTPPPPHELITVKI